MRTRQGETIFLGFRIRPAETDSRPQKGVWGMNAGGFRIRQIIFSPIQIHIWYYNSILSKSAIVDNMLI